MIFFLIACVESPVDVVIGGECGNNCARFERGHDVLSGQDPQGYAPIEDNTIYNFVGGGIVIADFNGDGWDDVFLPTQVQDELFFGGEEGFQKDDSWLPDTVILSVGGAAADYDGDGDFDLFVSTNFSSDRLYRNDGDGFVDVSLEAGIDQEDADTAPVVWGDYDLDGDLDLFVGGHLDHLFEGSQSNPNYEFPEASRNILYENQGNGTFDAIVMEYYDPEPYTLAAAWLSYGNGVRPDLYLVNDFGPLVIGNRLLVPRDTQFTPYSYETSGVEVDMYGMGISVGDINGDQLPDIWLSNWMQPKLLLSTGSREWYNASASLGLETMRDNQRFSWGTALVDFENDGDLDAWLGYGPLPGFEEISEDDEILDDAPVQPDAFFLNTGDGFVDKGGRWELNDDNITRGGVFSDLNRDGVQDLVRSSMLGPAEVFWGTQNHGDWLEVELRDEGMNRFGIGARIDVVDVEGKTWSHWIVSGDSFASSGPPRAHFGFGPDAQIEQIDVLWPDGGRGLYAATDLNQRIMLVR